MKTNFLKHVRQVSADALDFIKATVIEHKKIEFFKGMPKGDEDAFYDLPTITNVDKHYNYEQFAILSVEKVGKEVILHTKGRGDNDELKDFVLTQISNDDVFSLCEIAYLIGKSIQTKKHKK